MNERGASKSRPWAVLVLVLALAFQGLSGIAGGIGLVTDPSGRSIGIPIAWLDGSPFENYRIPGMVLLTLLGIAPLLAAYGAWTRRRWSWTASLAVGVSLLMWLGVEISVIGYQSEPPLQAIYGVVGVLIIAPCLSSAVRSHLISICG